MNKTIGHVIFTNMYANLGGGEFALLAHIKAMKAKGYSVSVILLEDGEFCHTLNELSIPYTIIPFYWKGSKVLSLFMILKVISLFGLNILRCKPKLIVSYTFNDFFFSAIVSKLVGVPIMFRSQGENFPDGVDENKTWLGKYFCPFINFIGASVVCTTCSELHSYIGGGVNSVSVEYLGVKDFYGQSLTEYQLINDIPVIGIFGRLVAWKGHKTYILALAKLKNKGVGFSAIIVGGAGFGGGDAYVEELKELVRFYGLEDCVDFLGFRDDVNELMLSCDIICHCSEFEPFGLVIIEAMMAGRVVIASDVSGPSEIVENNVNGILIKPNDSKVLAETISHLLGNKNRIEDLAREARKCAKSRFDLENNMSNLMHFCEKMMY